MKLYDSLISANAYKIRLLLAHLDLPYERVELDILAGDTRNEEFRAKNVAFRVPVLELDDGTALPESGAILAFLGEGTSWLPGEGDARAQVMRWLFFEQNFVEPTIAVVRFIRRWGSAEPSVIDWLTGRGNEALDILERHLEDRTWMASDHPTLADLALFGYTHVADEGGFDLGLRPALRAFHQRVAGLEGHISIDHVPTRARECAGPISTPGKR